MKIKNKLLFAIGGSLLLLLALSFDVLVLLTTDTITQKLNYQLKSQLENATSQVSDLINTSARAYLTAIGLRSNAESTEMYNKYKRGELTYKEAYDNSLEFITNFKFLNSGIVFVANDMGIIISHPNKTKIETIAPMQAWIQRQNPQDRSFKSYEFQSKNKLVYRIYNNSFKYNICVDANTAEFLASVNLDDLNKTMNSIKVGLTGYPFLLTKNGTYLTNPDKSKIGKNILNNLNSEDNSIFNSILSDKNGSFQFNTLDKFGNKQNKFLSFNKEANSELIVCLTGVVNEFYDTVDIIKKGVYLLGLIVLVILTVVIFVVSSTITIPIRTFSKSLYSVVHEDGDLTKRIKLQSSDEIGTMVELFNNFIGTLQDIIIDIKKTSKALFLIKDNILFRINESTSSVKKILTNIVSIKNQAKQLDLKIEKSVESTKDINININSLNRSILNQTKVIETTSFNVESMVSSFYEIENLVKKSRDNSLFISTKVVDIEAQKYLKDIIKSLENIKIRTDKLHIGSEEIINNIYLLKEASTSVSKRAISIKKQSNEVDEILVETKNIATYVVESMDMITSSSKKITNSMDALNYNANELENYGEKLQDNIDRFTT